MATADDIINLENQYWKNMAAGNFEETARMIASEGASLGAMGANTFTPASYLEMASKSPFKISDWTLSNEKVIFPRPDVAVLIYRAKYTLSAQGRTDQMDEQAASIWVQDGDSWKAAFHVDMPASAK